MEYGINKVELMKRAWEIARNAAGEFGGYASEYIAESMKTAWTEAKASVGVNVVKLTELGREWIRGDHHRIYFNDMTKYANTDSLRKWQIRDLAGHSVYYNVNDNEWYRSPEIKEYFNEIKLNILARI